MASTAGFRHNRLKRRHLEPDGDLMPENKRYFSEKFAQEMGVLKLDDHATVPQSIGSPQSPYSSSPPQTFTPPPSPFHNPSYTPSSPSPFSSSPSPFSSSPQSSSNPFSSQPPSSSALFSQRFTSQNFQNQLHQLQQLHHPVNQYQLQQQLQNHQIFQMRQPSSPPTTPTSISSPEKPKLEPKAVTLFQPFQFTVKNPELDTIEDEEEEEEAVSEGDEKLPKFKVNLPDIRAPELLLPIPQEDLSKALILYSSPSEVIQDSIHENEKRAARAHLEKLQEKLMQEKLPLAEDVMEDLEPTTTNPAPYSPFPSPSTFAPPPPFSSTFPPTSPSSIPSFPPSFAAYPSPLPPSLSPTYPPPFPPFNPPQPLANPTSDDSMVD